MHDSKSFSRLPTFEEVMAFTSGVSGNAAFEDPECRLFYDVLTKLRTYAIIAEIGCQYGRSSSIILQAAPHFADLHFIDPFEEPEIAGKWLEMAHRTQRYFTLHLSPSALIMPFPLDLILIDGDHTTEGVTKDMRHLEMAKPGAFACFHDYGRESLPEVFAAVNGYMAHSPEWKMYAHEGTLGIWRRG